MAQTIKTRQRLLASIERGKHGCWLWTKGVTKKGYGRLRVDGMVSLAHRVSYLYFTGDIPDGLHVLHNCDTPACINPSHLFLGTNDENILDRQNKDRQAKGTSIGISKLNELQVKAIRVWLNKGYTTYLLKDVFKVSKTTIQNIKSCKTWKHVI